MTAKKLNLFQRLSLISEEADKIPKNGYNSFSKYKYVQAVDVIGSIKKLLIKHGIFLSIKENSVTREQYGKNFHSTIHCTATFTNVDDPKDSINVDYSSTAADTLDKDIFKAKTGGMKYLFTQMFLIVTDDFIDPEEQKPLKPGHRDTLTQTSIKGSNAQTINKKRDKLLQLISDSGTAITKTVEDWVDSQPENIIDQQIERMNK